jgi:hypothetical protein
MAAPGTPGVTPKVQTHVGAIHRMTIKNAKTLQPLLLGVSLMVLLQGCTSTSQDATAVHPDADVVTQEIVLNPTVVPSSNRLVFEGCEPAEAVKGYVDMIGEDVLISMAWKNASERIANLEVPAVVLRVDSPYLVVAFNRKVPNLEFYSAIWLTAGHIKAMPDGAFGLDMCSATLKKGGWE